MKYDVAIIGAGIVGLATAYQLQQKDPRLKICVIEKEAEVATHQSGHNSGVIHSGIYYKPGSLKATNCVSGYRRLIDFAKQHNIQTDICGKIIVAVRKEQISMLHNIFDRGNKNCLADLRMISAAEIQQIEPHVTSAIAGIYVPQAGIIDFKKVAQKLAHIIVEKGAGIFFNSKAVFIKRDTGEVNIETTSKKISASLLINCAGLYSDVVARLTHPQLNMRIIPFRGEFYKLKKEKEYLVKNLIYPVPDPAFPFLGVHFTRRIEGGIEAGPNAVLAFRREGYHLSDFNASEFIEILRWPGFQKIALKYWRTELRELYRSFLKREFVKALKELIPEVKDDDLEPARSGVRAQAVDRDGNLVDDFLILQNPRVLNVCNAPSPAATSCLAIGDHISEKAMEILK